MRPDGTFSSDPPTKIMRPDGTWRDAPPDPEAADIAAINLVLAAHAASIAANAITPAQRAHTSLAAIPGLLGGFVCGPSNPAIPDFAQLCGPNFDVGSLAPINPTTTNAFYHIKAGGRLVGTSVNPATANVRLEFPAATLGDELLLAIVASRGSLKSAANAINSIYVGGPGTSGIGGACLGFTLSSSATIPTTNAASSTVNGVTTTQTVVDTPSCSPVIYVIKLSKTTTGAYYINGPFNSRITIPIVPSWADNAILLTTPNPSQDILALAVLSANDTATINAVFSALSPLINPTI